MDRNILVVSGPTLSGKSWLLEQLAALPEFQNATVVRMDDIRRQFWGERTLTSTEGVFRNELTRNEVKKQLIVDGVETVLLEMPLLTRLHHQQPLVEMVKSTQAYIQAMELELGCDKTALSTVHLRVALLFVDPVTAGLRLSMRNAGANTSNTDVFRLEEFLSILARYELPEAYSPLVLDTSTGNELLEETVSFFRGGVPDQSVMYERRQHFSNIIDSAKAEMKK